MTAVFVIPGPLRELAGGREEVRVQGKDGSVAEALSLLWAECPGLRDRVLTELGEVRPHINIFLNGENIRYARGLRTRITGGAEIIILPALSGG
jgi:molybdopterin converting factor small subunit